MDLKGLNLETLVDRQRDRQPCQKGASRLQETKAETKLTTVDGKAFKKDVWHRDKHHCRMCQRKVLKAIARIPERGDVHHLHGRLGDLQFEAKCAVLVCCECHEKLTGRVAEKWIAVGTKFWLLNGDKVIDARKTILFRKVA